MPQHPLPLKIFYQKCLPSIRVICILPFARSPDLGPKVRMAAKFHFLGQHLSDPSLRKPHKRARFLRVQRHFTSESNPSDLKTINSIYTRQESNANCDSRFLALPTTPSRFPNQLTSPSTSEQNGPPGPLLYSPSPGSNPIHDLQQFRFLQPSLL